MLEKNKALEEFFIKLLNTLLITYERHPSNYYNSINIINSARLINDDIEEKNKMIDYELFEKMKENNKRALKKIETFENKYLNELNAKLGLKLKGDEISINLDGKNIGSIELKLLSNIEFKNLKEIDLSNNDIIDINPLKDFKTPKLKSLDLSFNKIIKVDPFKEILKNIPEIEYLDLSNNLIKNADVFKDKIFEKIIQINLNNNKILQKDLDEIKRILGFHLIIYENSKFTLTYKLDKCFNRIRIFGKKFVENNKNKCYIIIHNNKNELSEYYEYAFNSKKSTIGINLIIDKSIFDIS